MNIPMGYWVAQKDGIGSDMVRDQDCKALGIWTVSSGQHPSNKALCHSSSPSISAEALRPRRADWQEAGRTC